MSENAVESLTGFELLIDHDKEELAKFVRYMRLLREPSLTAESAYVEVYGEVVFEDKTCTGKT